MLTTSATCLECVLLMIDKQNEMHVCTVYTTYNIEQKLICIRSLHAFPKRNFFNIYSESLFLNIPIMRQHVSSHSQCSTRCKLIISCRKCVSKSVICFLPDIISLFDVEIFWSFVIVETSK